MLTNLLERLGFNLANTFTRNPKLRAHLLERVVGAVDESMTHFQNLSLLVRQGIQNFQNLVGQNAVRYFLIW